MFISRVDTPRARGWQFRIERTALTVRKFFSDSKYGSRTKALKAAKKFRDRFVREHKVQLPQSGVLVYHQGRWRWQSEE